MNIGEEIQVHEIEPEEVPFEGEEIAEEQADGFPHEVEVPVEEEQEVGK